MGPRTAVKKEDGLETGKAPITLIYNIRKVTPRLIAYITMIVSPIPPSHICPLMCVAL